MSDLLNQASLVMVPSGYKEDTVYSVVPSDGSGDLSFTRASNGTRINSAGLVEVCPWNLLQSSETFNLSPWNTNAGATITNTTQIAPNGTVTADILSASTSTSSGIYQVVTGNVVGQVYTASLYVKNDSGATSIKYQEENCAAGILFNAVTGAITGTFGTVISSSVENVGNGWYRIQFAYTSTITTNVFIIYSTLGSANTFVLWGAQLNIGSTAKPYFPTTDRLNVPRLTYQNGGGGCPSLLLEKQSTNYARKNNDFVDWTNNEITKNLNAGTSPDGTNNAINYVPNTVNSYHMTYDNATGQASGGNFTMSCYAKANGYNKFSVRESQSIGYYASFNLSNGTVIDNGGNTATIENVGNGWYRCIVSVVYSGNVCIGLLPLSDAYTSGQPLTHSYAGDGTKGVLVYGPQLEVSTSYATSLISTAGVASATRVADVAQKTGISSLMGQTAGTIFLDYNLITASQDIVVMNAVGLPNNDIAIIFIGNSLEIYCFNNFVEQFRFSLNGYKNTNRYKIAIGYANNNTACYINGSLVGTDTSCTFNITDSIFYTSADYNAHKINESVLFKTRLTNAELASLTTL
jgi:hypothetical protein